MPMDKASPPLEGLLVVDMSQFLSGPYCLLCLLDCSACIIKIEWPDGGDLSRQLYLSDTEMGGDSTIFHTINRSKESFAVDMKDKADIAALKKLLARADVLIQNFQLGIIKWLGLGYKSVREINPRIVYSCSKCWGCLHMNACLCILLCCSLPNYIVKRHLPVLPTTAVTQPQNPSVLAYSCDVTQHEVAVVSQDLGAETP
jgi:crotonobetainyl-CoA:carnitine CoA-transferase CaiB-like acyl-CoA transferase